MEGTTFYILRGGMEQYFLKRKKVVVVFIFEKHRAYFYLSNELIMNHRMIYLL